jgi:hypothetical protein
VYYHAMVRVVEVLTRKFSFYSNGDHYEDCSNCHRHES